MNPTYTDRRLAEIHTFHADGALAKLLPREGPAHVAIKALERAQEDIAWLLALVQRLSRPVGAIGTLEGILWEIRRERAAQDRKWGQQDHRDACPVLLDRPGGASHQRLAEDLEIPTADRARVNCQVAFERGQGHWSAILVEEVAEAVGAIGDDAALRRELVQSAAVNVAWIEAIDRRTPHTTPSPPSSPIPPAALAGSAASHSREPTGSEGGHGRVRTCPDCTGRTTHAGACLTCAGTGFVGVP